MHGQISDQLVRNYLENFFKINFRVNSPLRPLVLAYSVTHRCNFHCSYCDLARSGQTRTSGKELSTEDIKKLLSIIKKDCPCIYFTGGEPLVRNDIVDILKASKQLGFKSVSMVSNMSLIHEKMGVLDYLDNLVVSFDMVDEEKYAKILGVKTKIVTQVKQNIIECAALRKEKGFSMTVNFVITEDTIHSAREVMEFCFNHDIWITLGPEVRRREDMHTSFRNNEDYKRLIEDVIAAKKQGNPVLGSEKYLRTILEFTRFACYPTLTPRVFPNGDLFYPCPPGGTIAANILEEGSYKSSLNKGIEKYGPLPVYCSCNHYMNCYIDPPQFVKNPFLAFREFA